jgi:hypothetical protein
MAYFYTDPERESVPHTLPNAEVFHADAGELAEWFEGDDGAADEEIAPAGFYVWSCFPGCMPDSEPTGPFETEAEAVAYWRDMFED